jgi:phosphate transport system permease protein
MSETLVAQTPVSPAQPARRAPTDWKTNAMQTRIRKRYASERRFRLMGALAVLVSVAFLAFLLVTMIGNGVRGFTQTEVRLPLDLRAAKIQPSALESADLEGLTSKAATAAFGAKGPNMLSDGAWQAVRDAIEDDPTILTRATEVSVPVSTKIDLVAKGHGDDAEAIAAHAALAKAGRLSSSFNANFLTASDSTDPTRAGIWGALKGSLITMLVTLLMAFPIGVFAAVYLEEYAPRNRWTDLIEVSINNLAAVPSIIFGLLGLAVFLNFMHLPRSAALVGGMTLALMTMPVIVIAGRNAIKSVPPSIRDAAFGVGASPVQVVFHHVLPLALPGILTGTIIGMARALGETAPLLMIGMRAFIASPPGGITDPATVLPVQIFLWSDEVSRGFVEKTSAAIIVLLVFLLTMNGLAIYLRNKFERRW